jgi:hypothetical protein
MCPRAGTKGTLKRTCKEEGWCPSCRRKWLQQHLGRSLGTLSTTRTSLYSECMQCKKSSQAPGVCSPPRSLNQHLHSVVAAPHDADRSSLPRSLALRRHYVKVTVDVAHLHTTLTICRLVHVHSQILHSSVDVAHLERGMRQRSDDWVVRRVVGVHAGSLHHRHRIVHMATRRWQRESNGHSQPRSTLRH